jgi:hypothetical protein
VIASGALIAWHHGAPVEVARLEPARWTRALQTTYGVLVLGHGLAARLVSATGEVSELDAVRNPNVVLLGDGRRLAVADSEHHRLVSRYSLRLVDLAGGPDTEMPWPADRSIGLLGAHGKTVFFAGQHPPATTMRWTPGTDPEPHPHPVRQVDPLTGTCIAPTREGMTVYRPDGTAVPVPVDYGARLAPGGDRLWTARAQPPALTLFPVVPGEVRPEVHWLPEDGPRSVQGAYGEPHWEDTGHVLFGYQPWHFPRAAASGIRLSVTDGAVQRLPPVGRPGSPVLFVESLVATEQTPNSR